MNVGTHQSHCCFRHGCKYSDENCPVELGEIKQDPGQCMVGGDLDEDCSYESDEDQQNKELAAFVHKLADRFPTITRDMVARGTVRAWIHEQANLIERGEWVL